MHVQQLGDSMSSTDCVGIKPSAVGHSTDDSNGRDFVLILINDIEY